MQIIYFPYLSLRDKDELDFGVFKIWNFQKKASDYILDENLRDHIQKLLEANVRHNTPIQNIGIFSIGNIDFRELSDVEMSLLREARLLLFLAFLSKVNANVTGVNAGHYIATSENFIHIIQNFDPSRDTMGETTGFIVRKIDFGYRIGEIKFNAPSHIPSPVLGFSIDNDLVFQMLRLRNKGKRLYARILRAIELFYESFFNDTALSHNARILLQMGAFEVLLNLPEAGQRRAFKDLVEQYTVRAGEKNRSYFSERLSGKVKEQRPLKVKWADRFYTLRNHIIHGNVVSSVAFHFEKRQRHIDIALLFFILLVKEKLNEKIGNRYFYDDLVWKRTEYAIDGEMGFEYKDGSITRRLRRVLRIS